MSFVTIGIAVVSLLFAWIFIKVRKAHSHWENLGVPGPRPAFLIGNIPEMTKESRAHIDVALTKRYGKMFGYYLGLEPLLSDPELIKQVMIKDFADFADRRKLNTFHEMWNDNLFNAPRDYWKRIRTITTPAFTSAKLRGMQPLMRGCVDKLANYLNKVVAQNGGIMTDPKEVMAGFSIDVIGSTVFATETNANDERESENQFVAVGKSFFKVKPLRAIVAFTMPPFVNRLLDIKTIFEPKSFDFFVDFIREVVQQRKKTNSLSDAKRNDFVQLLLDAAVDEEELNSPNYNMLTASMEEENVKQNSADKSMKKALTEKEIIANCILFFAGGFEGVSTTLFHALYELARNADVQERLYQELSQATATLNDKSDDYFEQVYQQSYLDAFIKETLRKYPQVVVLWRTCTKEGYNLGGVALPKGQRVEISTYSVHHNPEYYPEPERFDPERFMPYNKHLLVPNTYLPFGSGPRNCIGLRFAYQEMKLCLAKIALEFTVHQTDQTPAKPTFRKGAILATEPFPLRIAKRN